MIKGKRRVTLKLTDEQATQVWHALEEKKDSYQKDLRTRCDGALNYGVEDEMFLGTSIGAIAAVQFQLQEEGYTA